MKKPLGFVLYEGKSILDGQPVVAIATLKSGNAKTGNMIQTWIIRSDMNPVAVANSKLDGTICGSCPHRQSLGGACYVNIGQAPNAVYKTFKAGKYPKLTDEAREKYIDGRDVRLGAYGDPAAIPFEVWSDLVQGANSHTGYTHQARHPNFDGRITELCMLSADTPKQALKAQSKGQRTFRVKTPEAPLLDGEIECLADSKGLTCQECGLCDGANSANKPNIVINVHGSRSKRYEDKFSKANIIAVA